MANGRAEMAVREVKRQCRTLRNSAEQNTSVRISDDSPLLSWLFRFTAQVMNKMTIGKDGKTSEMRRTCRRWIKPTNVERNFGFVKLEETVSVLLQVAWLKESLLVIMIEIEQFCALPRMELCEEKVGQDRH